MTKPYRIRHKASDKYLILGFKDETGWIRKFTPNVVVDNGYVSYRLADANYVAWING